MENNCKEIKRFRITVFVLILIIALCFSILLFRNVNESLSASASDYFTSAKYTKFDTPIFNIDGSVNSAALNAVKEHVKKIAAANSDKAALSAEDFGKYADGKLETTEQFGITLIKLFPETAVLEEPTETDPLNSVDELKKAVAQYWQLVYATTKDSSGNEQLVVTLYMANPYGYSGFQPTNDYAANYSNSYVRDKLNDLYARLDKKFTTLKTAAVEPNAVSWQSGTSQTGTLTHSNLKGSSGWFWQQNARTERTLANGLYDNDFPVLWNGYTNGDAFDTTVAKDKLWLPSTVETVYENHGSDEHWFVRTNGYEPNSTLQTTIDSRSGLWRLNAYDRGFAPDSSITTANTYEAWLRSGRSDNAIHADIISANGNTNASNPEVNLSVGVRPAMHLNLSAFEFNDVTAYANGGEIPATEGWTIAAGNGSATKQVLSDTAYGILPAPTRDYYNFEGWFDKDGTAGVWGNRITAETVMNKTNPVTSLYAKWSPKSYDVSYVLNGGAWNGAEGVNKYVYGTGISALPTNLSLTGYSPDGWYDKDGTGGVWGNKITSVGASEYGNKTFYAKWNLNAPSVTIAENEFNEVFDPDKEYTLHASVDHDLTGLTYKYQWYKDGKAITGATGATHNIKYVADSGKYKVEVSAEDSGGSASQIGTSPEKTFIITKASYPMNVTFESSTAEYDKQPHSLTLSGTLPAGVSVSYEGSATYVDDGSVTVTATFSVTDADNYNVPDKLSATITIIPREIVVTIDDKTSVYGEPLVPLTSSVTSVKQIVDGDTEVYSISTTASANSDAGTYDISGTVNNNNYSIIFRNSDGTKTVGKYEITKANYDMTGVSWDYDPNDPFVYDNTVKTVSVTGLPSGVTVKAYSDNSKTDAGNYTASASFNFDELNYILPTVADCSWEIKKAVYDMTGVSWDYDPNDPFVYDNTVKTVSVIGLPSGVTVNAYSDNSKTDAGEYTASVSLNFDEANYEMSTVADCNWEIKKAVYDMTGVSWDYNPNDPFVYDKGVKTVSVIGLPSGVTVNAYSDNSKTDAGKYSARASFNFDELNYKLPAVADCSWEIKKAANFWISEFAREDWTYNSAPSTVTAPAAGFGEPIVNYYTDRSCTKIYSENFDETTPAGKYYAKVTVAETENYGALSNIYEFSVRKAVYDLPIRFENKTFVENGGEFNLEITGTLPKGVTVTYDGNGKREPGRYTVTAKFRGDDINYEPIPNKTAVMTINAVEISNENNDVIVEEPEEGFDPDYVVTIEDVTDSSSELNVDDGKNTEKVIDVTISKDGRPVNPDRYVTVRILIDETLRGENGLQVFREERGGSFTDMNATREGDYMVFTTDRMGKYVITAPKDEEETPIGLIAGLSIGIPLLVLLVIFIIVYLILAKRKKDKKKTENKDAEADKDDTTEF